MWALVQGGGDASLAHSRAMEDGVASDDEGRGRGDMEEEGGDLEGAS